MQAAVVAGELAEAGGGAGFGDRPLCHASDCRGVVAQVFQGGVAHRVVAHHHVQLRQLGGLLQIAVGHATGGVVVGHQVGLHVVRKGVSPHVPLPVLVKVDAAHASFGGVGGSQEGRVLSHEFREVSGPRAQAGCQSGEGF